MTLSMSVKIAVVPPIPSATVSTATLVGNSGARVRTRNAQRMSLAVRSGPHPAAHIADLFGHAVHVAELQTGGPPVGARRHAFGPLPIDQHDEVVVELPPELALDLLRIAGSTPGH